MAHAITASPPETREMSFSRRRTLVLGLGLFAIELAAGLYNAYVPLFIKQYVASAGLIGLIVAFRSLSSLVLNVYFSARSDRTWTRFGRRLPYILVGMPISAVLFFMLSWQLGATFLITVDIVYSFASNIFYAPVIALMPDVTPSNRRSQANGLINLMAGVGALLAYFVAPALFHVSRQTPFAVVAVMFLLIPVIMKVTIKEPERIQAAPQLAFRYLWDALTEIVWDSDHTTLFLLIAICGWSLGFGAVRTFFTLYGVTYLHLPQSTAVYTSGVFALAYVIFAFPSGLIVSRIPRPLAVRASALGLGVVFIVLGLVHALPAIVILAVLGGMFWAVLNVNGYPWLMDLTKTKVGAYTGLFILSTGIAGVAGQPLVGDLMDRFGYPALFFSTGIVCLLSFVLALFARTTHAQERVDINP